LVFSFFGDEGCGVTQPGPFCKAALLDLFIFYCLHSVIFFTPILLQTVFTMPIYSVCGTTEVSLSLLPLSPQTLIFSAFLLSFRLLVGSC
jgi:hypothetical protein